MKEAGNKTELINAIIIEKKETEGHASDDIGIGRGVRKGERRAGRAERQGGHHPVLPLRLFGYRSL